jgi:multidrug efflux pump subunit AcrA (membrane-fusion protein)
MFVTSTRLLRLAIPSLALAAFATACSHAQSTPSTSAAVVPVSQAQQGTVYPRTVLSGIIAPLQNVGITSSLTEPADAVYVKEGEHVHRGQVLAQLDTADLRAQLAQYQATMNSSGGGSLTS